MGSASSKSDSLDENKSASESIHVEFERIEKNLNKSIHSELVKAEEEIANLREEVKRLNELLKEKENPNHPSLNLLLNHPESPNLHLQRLDIVFIVNVKLLLLILMLHIQLEEKDKQNN